MRFPFFATNKQLDSKAHGIWQAIYNEQDGRHKQDKALMGLQQKVLVLEGRINKLEGAKKHGKKR